MSKGGKPRLVAVEPLCLSTIELYNWDRIIAVIRTCNAMGDTYSIARICIDI